MPGQRAKGGLIVALMMLAGCAGSTQVSEPAAPATPKLDMNGRWMLSAPNAPSCGMTFEAPPGAREGAIRPEGGCPGDFFMSRHWTLAQGQLTINDHNNAPLGQLTLSGDSFAGKSTAGAPVTLARAVQLQ